jgi:hypothetical protein
MDEFVKVPRKVLEDLLRKIERIEALIFKEASE